MGLFQRKKIDFSEVTESGYDVSKQIISREKNAHQTPPAVRSSDPQSPKNSLNSTLNNQPTSDALEIDAKSANNPAEFGISDLVKLFHSLPQQNIDAEISTVVRTITSFNINIENLIEDLTHKESLAKKRVKVLELEIELFKSKIKNRKKELDLLQIGICELAKTSDHLQQGLTTIKDENNDFTQRMLKKKTANLKKIPELSDPIIPIAEKIRIAASRELEQVNSKGKIKSLRDKFKRRILK